MLGPCPASEAQRSHFSRNRRSPNTASHMVWPREVVDLEPINGFQYRRCMALKSINLVIGPECTDKYYNPLSPTNIPRSDSSVRKPSFENKVETVWTHECSDRAASHRPLPAVSVSFCCCCLRTLWTRIPTSFVVCKNFRVELDNV